MIWSALPRVIRHVAHEAGRGPIVGQDPDLNGERRLPDSRAKRRLNRSLEKLRTAYVNALGDIVDGVLDGASIDDAILRARTVMGGGTRAAVRMGHRLIGYRVGPTQAEQRDLALLVESELVYFRRFLEEIGSVKNRDARLQLYGGFMDDVFWRGWLSGVPDNVSIEWHLGVAEHCTSGTGVGGCIELHAGSPYALPGQSPNPLPTVPRGGDTPCLGNCRCYLVARGGGFESTIVNEPGVEVTAIGDIPVSPTSPGAIAAAQIYQDLAERHAWHTRMDEADPGRGHGAAAREIAQEISRLAERHGHTARFRATLGELIEPILIARAAGLRFVPPRSFDDDLTLLVASILAIRDVEHGRIETVTQDPPLITLDGDGRQFRFDEVGRAILFVDER